MYIKYFSLFIYILLFVIIVLNNEKFIEKKKYKKYNNDDHDHDIVHMNFHLFKLILFLSINLLYFCITLLEKNYRAVH